MTATLKIPSLTASPTTEPEPEPDQHSELSATRHLCAGVYLDRSFRDLIIRKVHNDSRRRVAPSYGFDLVPVVRHAWRAWVLELVLHTAALAVLTTGLVLDHTLAVITVLCAFTAWVVLIFAVRNLAEFVHLRATSEMTRWTKGAKRRKPHRNWDEESKRKRRFKASFAGCVVLALTPIIVAGKLDLSLRASLPAMVALAGSLLLCGMVVGVLRQLQLNANQHARSLRPTNPTRREEAIDQQQNHECVVYERPTHKKGTDDPLDLLLSSGESQSPFVGTGKLVNRWLPPMTVQLLRPDPINAQGLAQREHTSPPFRARELVDHLKSALEQLTTDTGAENLPGLRVCHRLYIAEPDVSTNRQLFEPNLNFMINRIIDNPLALAHHFLETSVPIAGGELVTTVLIRVSLKGRCLSLDVATCALTRTPPDFQKLDRYAENGFGAVVRAAFRALFDLPKDVLGAWRIAKIPVVLGGAWWAVKDRTSKPRRRVQVSPQVTIREKVAGSWSNAQLDKTTIYDHMKIIEQRILKATADFLKAHDVDTSAFEQQATNIINSGVLNMGGVNTVSESAIGESARVMLGAAQDVRGAAQNLQDTTKEQSA